MAQFKRFLPKDLVDALNNLKISSEINWWNETLAHPELRLAIRDGSLSVYVDGQSVFEVHLDLLTGQPRARTHYKYLLRPTALENDSAYVSFDGAGFKHAGGPLNPSRFFQTEYTPGRTVSEMVRAAKGYAIAEKRDVDDLLASDRAVIDIEIAASEERPDKSGHDHLRVDVAALHRTKAGKAKVVFYEVKRASSKELRSGSPKEPPVVMQMKSYDRFCANQKAKIAEAYIETAKTLISLVEGVPGRTYDGLVHEVVSSRDLEVDPQSRLLITGFDDDTRVGSNFRKRIDSLVGMLGGRVYAVGSAKGVRLSKLRAEKLSGQVAA